MSGRHDYRGTRTLRLLRALVEAHDGLMKADEARIRGYGLSQAEFDCVVTLGEETGPLRMCDLAQRSLVTKSHCTHIVKQLMQELADCGGYDGPQDCREPKPREDVVVDATCREQLGLDVQEGQLYVLQVELDEAKNCHLQCVVQTFTGKGDVPCPVVPIQD